MTDTLNTTQEITGISLHTPTWNTTTGRGTIEVCHQKPLNTAALPGWIIEHDEVISHNGRSDLEHGDTVHLKVDCADPRRACHSVDGYYLNPKVGQPYYLFNNSSNPSHQEKTHYSVQFTEEKGQGWEIETKNNFWNMMKSPSASAGTQQHRLNDTRFKVKGTGLYLTNIMDQLSAHHVAEEHDKKRIDANRPATKTGYFGREGWKQIHYGPQIPVNISGWGNKTIRNKLGDRDLGGFARGQVYQWGDECRIITEEWAAGTSNECWNSIKTNGNSEPIACDDPYVRTLEAMMAFPTSVHNTDSDYIEGRTKTKGTYLEVKCDNGLKDPVELNKQCFVSTGVGYTLSSANDATTTFQLIATLTQKRMHLKLAEFRQDLQGFHTTLTDVRSTLKTTSDALNNVNKVSKLFKDIHTDIKAAKRMVKMLGMLHTMLRKVTRPAGKALNTAEQYVKAVRTHVDNIKKYTNRVKREADSTDKKLENYQGTVRNMYASAAHAVERRVDVNKVLAAGSCAEAIYKLNNSNPDAFENMSSAQRDSMPRHRTSIQHVVKQSNQHVR